MLSQLLDLTTLLNAQYGWAVVFSFLVWEFYNPLPFHDTKVQSYFDNFKGEIRELRKAHIDTKDRLTDIAHQQQRSIQILRAVVRETDGVEDQMASQYLLQDNVPVSHFQEDPSEEDLDMDERQHRADDPPTEAD